MHYILEEIEEKNYSIPILVLLLLKAWPGYESKEGDVKDFDILYDKVIAFMNDITKNSGYFEQMPAVNDAMQELHKTRITLLNHVKCILSSYADFASPSSIYELSQLMKDNLVDLDIEGYWNEYGGKMSRSDFWLIEKTAYAGMYFATKYNKKQNNVVEKLRYSMQISKSATSLFVYLIHPKAVKHLVNGIAYDEGDHCYYQAERPKDRNDVTELNLTRTYNYKGWENRITLTKGSPHCSICASITSAASVSSRLVLGWLMSLSKSRTASSVYFLMSMFLMILLYDKGSANRTKNKEKCYFSFIFVN